jgi:hypothetical protein
MANQRWRIVFAAVPAERRVYVHNLPFDLSNEELASHMASAGHVVYAEIMIRTNGESKVCLYLLPYLRISLRLVVFAPYYGNCGSI